MLTVSRHGGVLAGPDWLRQMFNDTDAEVLWLIIVGVQAQSENKPEFEKDLRS